MANKKVSQLVSKPSVLVTDLFPIADPTTGQLFKTTISDLGTAIGSGVSSVNTLVGAVVLDTDDIQELASPTNRWFTDTRARAALSASSPLAYNSGTGVFSIPAATSSQDGYLTSADWTTFNAKQAALNGTGFVKISGTTISYDNSTYLTTSAAASTYLALAGGTLTGALNGTSATFTGDLTLSASNPRLYFTDTDNNPDYFISNTDGTFTIYDVTNSTSRLTLTNLYTTLNNTVKIQGDILLNQDSTIGPVAGYTTIASDASGIFLRLGTASSHAYLVLSGLTSFRNFTLPDATGTFALTSDLSAYLPLAGGTMSGAITTTNVYLTGMTAGSGALYYSSGSNRVTVANYNASGIVTFEVNGGNTALTLNSNLSATFAGAISGTSASFSSSVTANNLVIRNSGVPAAQFYRDLDVTVVGSAGQGIEFGARSGSTYIAGAAIYGGLDNPATTGNLVFQTLNGGSLGTRLTIANNGAATFSNNVGIGGPSLGDILHIMRNGTTSYAAMRVTNTNSTADVYFGIGGSAVGNVDLRNNAYVMNSGASSLAFGTNDTVKMTITSGGSVGIGTLTPDTRLQVYSGFSVRTDTTGDAFMRLYRDAVPYAHFYMDRANSKVTIGSIESVPFTFDTGGSERMRITSGGYLKASNNGTYFNSTATYSEFCNNTLSTPALFLSQTNTSFNDNVLFIEGYNNTTNNTWYLISAYNRTSAAYKFRVADSGNVTNTNNSYGAISDIKLKENISDATSKLSDLLKIKVKNYNYIGSDEKQLGVIAQDVENVFPGLIEVHTDKDIEGNDLGTVTKSVKYSVFVPMLIKAVQELSDKIKTLENK